MYELVYAITQGASHIKSDIPCEDFGMISQTDNCLSFAVADGHGDSNCPRSQLGSCKACEIAIAELEAFNEGISDNAWEAELLEGGNRTDKLVRQLVVSIVAKWRKAVNEDYLGNPLTAEERFGCKAYIDRYDQGVKLEHIYGTTLIAGLLTQKYLLLLQQGDGRCVVFSSDGTVSQPIPWDDKCIANVTTSLCDEDAIQSFRFYVIDVESNPILACFAGTDGVEDSFASLELMESYYRDLLVFAYENGVEALNSDLNDKLPDFSAHGSGDDVTICGIIDQERLGDHISHFERESNIQRSEALIRILDDRLESMNGMGKVDAITASYEAESKKLAEAEAELEIAKSKLEGFEADLIQYNQFENDAPEKFKSWNRLMDVLLPENHSKALEKMSLDLQADVKEKERVVQELQDTFESIEKEYNEILSKKKELEDEKVAILEQLDKLQND